MGLRHWVLIGTMTVAALIGQQVAAETGPAEDVFETIDQMARDGKPALADMLVGAWLVCTSSRPEDECTAEIAARTPKWTITVETDPITDAAVVAMVRRSRDQDAFLMLICKEEQLTSVIDLPGAWGRDQVILTLRVDSAEPIAVRAVDRGSALHLLPNVNLEYLIWAAERLAVRATDRRGTVQTAVFDVDGLGAESYWLLAGCPEAAPSRQAGAD